MLWMIIGTACAVAIAVCFCFGIYIVIKQIFNFWDLTETDNDEDLSEDDVINQLKERE